MSKRQILHFILTCFDFGYLRHNIPSQQQIYVPTSRGQNKHPNSAQSNGIVCSTWNTIVPAFFLKINIQVWSYIN